MLQNYVNSFSDTTLIALHKECEQFSAHGMLPENAALRAMLEQIGLKSNYQTLTLATTAVYRALATKYVDDQKEQKVGLSVTQESKKNMEYEDLLAIIKNLTSRQLILYPAGIYGYFHLGEKGEALLIVQGATAEALIDYIKRRMPKD